MAKRTPVSAPFCPAFRAFPGVAAPPPGRLEWLGLYSHVPLGPTLEPRAVRRGGTVAIPSHVSGGRSGLLPGQGAQDRPERGHLHRRAAQHGVGRALHRRQGPAAPLHVGRGPAQGRPVVAGEPGHPHDRAVRRHQRQHRLAPGGGLQEPADRHPQRQLRRRLVRPRDEVRRLRRHHHHRRVARAGRRRHQGRRRRVRARPSPSTGACKTSEIEAGPAPGPRRRRQDAVHRARPART